MHTHTYAHTHTMNNDIELTELSSTTLKEKLVITSGYGFKILHFPQCDPS